VTTPTPTSLASDKRFAGWWVVGSVFLLFVANSGLSFYGLAVYLDALTSEQGFSTTSVSLATSMFFVVSGIAGRLIAPLIETRDIRWVIGAGAVISSGSLLALGSVDTIPKLYGVYAVFAIGFALCGLVPGTTLITRWFHTRRSVALSVASTGLSGPRQRGTDPRHRLPGHRGNNPADNVAEPREPRHSSRRCHPCAKD